MADYFTDTTGTLTLTQVTPVIQALFGAFELNPDYPGNGRAYIARLSQAIEPCWQDILERLAALCVDLQLVPETGVLEHGDALRLLAAHFGVTDETWLAEMIDAESDSAPDFDALFELARRFDDGHGLQCLRRETAWSCSKPRLEAFGGEGEFVGRLVCVKGCSTDAVNLGNDLEKALAAGDIAASAERLLCEIQGILHGVKDEERRRQLWDAFASRCLDKMSHGELIDPVTPSSEHQPTAANPALPTVVLEAEGGVVHGIYSSQPLRVLHLDADTEGADPAQIAEINGMHAYVQDFQLTAPAEAGSNGVAPDYVASVLRQLPPVV